jgi:hypothetical protein
VSNRGVWEPAEANAHYLNGQRRFLPSNEGYALVKSATADAYALYLAETGAMIGVTIVPNLDIPEDMNVIYFPLNPKYVKNGTLDGKVGLSNDPVYPNADIQRGSYFKSVEAYTLKNQVERQTSQLAAYYGQFNAARRGKSQDENLRDVIEDNPFYDWTQGIPRKSLVDTYVWTAASGTYCEQQSFTSIRQESQGGSYSFDWDLGVYGELLIVLGPIGIAGEMDLAGGTNWTVTVKKDKEEEIGYSLDVSAAPSAYLGSTTTSPDSAAPLPGKVIAYRFLTFYLAPAQRNRDDFFAHVVDRQWLQTSSDSQASALREAEATSIGKAVWRILHRVTYVSRIPPKFQTSPLATVPIALSAPANLEHNSLLLELVEITLHHKPDPTPAEIGHAVDTVLNVELAKVLPWWADFIAAARIPNSDAYVSFTYIRKDTIAYVNQYYAARIADK